MSIILRLLFLLFQWECEWKHERKDKTIQAVLDESIVYFPLQARDAIRGKMTLVTVTALFNYCGPTV